MRVGNAVYTEVYTTETVNMKHIHYNSLSDMIQTI